MKVLFPSLFICVQVVAQPVYFPLHVGDRWQYYNLPQPGLPLSGYSLRVAGDSLMSDGYAYAVMAGEVGQNTDFLRQVGDSVFFYNAGLKKGFVFFDFARRAGDTVSSTPNGTDTMDIVSQGAGLTIWFGRHLRTWTFSVNQGRRSIDDEFSITVVDSLGVTRRHPSFGDEYNLTGALIDGEAYGTIASEHLPAVPAPEALSLYQNYPNPFNPVTTIRYSIPGRSRVTLTVFNTLGEHVTTLVDGEEDPGGHEVRFDGRGLASGVYFYRLQAGRFIQTRRLILVR